jgi:ferredoxin-NADP reductase
MFDRTLAPLNRWALERVDREWVDYVVSNTMTDFNRRLNGFIWTYDLKAQVLEVIDEAPGVKTFVLRPNQHWRGMKAGQYIELDLAIDGELHRRHYSPTALNRGRIAITVKAVQGGKVSTWMHTHLRAGMQVNMGFPQGRFCHDGQDKLLFLCAGSGITPCRSIVSELLTRPEGERPAIQFIAQFREAGDVIFKDSLQRWSAAGVDTSAALTAEGGRMDAQALSRLCPDLQDRDIYLCGPAGFMTQMLADLRALHVDMARVHTERFVSAQSVEQASGDFQVAGSEIFFQHLNASITLTPKDQGKSMLDVAKAHGVNVESGCCQGMCGTCRLTVREGHASGNVLGKVVYLCTAFPASQRIVLDA